jgi:hypothetical protein
MRVLGALLLLIGLGLGFSPGSASAAPPCPYHAHAHGVASPAPEGQRAGYARAPAAAVETVSAHAPDLSGAPTPDPVTGHIVPEGQACCHAAPAVAPALGPALGPHTTTGRRIAPRSSAPVRPSLAFGIYRPPSTT